MGEERIKNTRGPFSLREGTIFQRYPANYITQLVPQILYDPLLRPQNDKVLANSDRKVA